jgi:hypothetical protein
MDRGASAGGGFVEPPRGLVLTQEQIAERWDGRNASGRTAQNQQEAKKQPRDDARRWKDDDDEIRE